MGPRHLDIDLILSEEERLPCIFLVEAAEMGHLDSSIKERNLPAGSRVELQHWLGEALSDKDMVRMEHPKHFGNKMRDEMRAGAGSVNLRDFSHYFFDVGLRLCGATKDVDLGRTLRAAFLGERYKRLMVRSLAQG